MLKGKNKQRARSVGGRETEMVRDGLVAIQGRFLSPLLWGKGDNKNRVHLGEERKARVIRCYHRIN